MTRKVGPDMLVAYLDRELTPAEVARVEAAIDGDPGLRARLASLERVDATLAMAFDPIVEAPLPPLALTERAHVSHRVVPMAGDGAMRFAWAAGIAGLIIGFAAGQLGPELLPVDEPVTVTAIQEQLPTVLETELSGTTVAFSDPLQGVSGTVKPISTFVNADGSYCRTYEARVVDEAGDLVSRGVACRDGEGHWVTRVQVNVV
jgi:surface antigen